MKKAFITQYVLYSGTQWVLEYEKEYFKIFRHQHQALKALEEFEIQKGVGHIPFEIKHDNTNIFTLRREKNHVVTN